MANKRLVYSAYMLLPVIVFCLFYKTVHYGFLGWDDSLYIENNENIRSLDLNTVKWAFSSFYLDCWIPLTWLSFSVNYKLGGLDPFGFHLVNVVLHACNAGIVILVSRAVFPLFSRREEPGDFPVWAGVFPVVVALLWAIHPMKVESVAWATERKDVLGAFFALLSMLFHLYRTQARKTDSAEGRPGRSLYSILSIVMFTLSMLVKPMAVALPLVFVLLDMSVIKAEAVGRVVTSISRNIGTIVISMIVSVITIASQSPNIENLNTFSSKSRFISSVISIASYFAKLIWPTNLSPKYQHGSSQLFFSDTRFLLACLILTSILFLFIWTRKKYPPLTLSISCFLLMLIPTPSFVQVGSQYMADRYTYLPSLFLIMPLAALPIAWCGDYPLHSLKGKLVTGLALIGVISVALCLGSLSLIQMDVWKSDLSLLSRAIDADPKKVGSIYFDRAMLHFNNANYPDALNDINKSLEIAQSKKYSKTHKLFFIRGNIWFKLNKFENALNDVNQAIAMSPDPPPDYFSLRDQAYSALRLAGKRPI